MTEAPPPNAPPTPDAADRATPDTTAGTAGKSTAADPASTTTRGPCAFISYSWTSDDHADWIRETAVRLLHDGVQVLLDQFDLAEGQDKYAFMEQAVTNPAVTHVLAFVDDRYATRADAREGGIGIETQILTPTIYQNARQKRVIPIILAHNPDGTPRLPTFLDTRYAIDMSVPDKEQDGYEQLLRVLHGKPQHVKPPVGTPPTFITDPTSSARPTRTRLRAFTEAVTRNRDITHSLAHDFLEAISTELPTLQITAVPDPATADDLIVQRITDAQPLRDDIVAFIEAIALHRQDDRLTRIAGDLFERLLAPQATAPGQANYRYAFDHYQFLGYDLFLHATALCIACHRLDLLAHLTDRGYLPPPFFHRDSRADSKTYTIFQGYCASLNETRNRRLKLNRTSVTADLIKEHAHHQRAPFEDLVSADLVLCLKSVLLTDGQSRWYPQLNGYAHTPPPMLRRAVHKANFADLTAFFHTPSGDDLRARFQSGATALDMTRWFQGRFPGADPISLLLVDQLDTKA
jgi:hypothetical protein